MLTHTSFRFVCRCGAINANVAPKALARQCLDLQVQVFGQPVEHGARLPDAQQRFDPGCINGDELAQVDAQRPRDLCACFNEIGHLRVPEPARKTDDRTENAADNLDPAFHDRPIARVRPRTPRALVGHMKRSGGHAAGSRSQHVVSVVTADREPAP